MLVVLSNAIILDCINPEPITGSSIIIENGRIVDISHKLPNSVDYRVIDLEGAYALPGIWDVHIHPKYPVSPMTSIAEQTVLFGQNLMEGLTESGVVGVRCGGAAHFMDVTWRKAFDSGSYIGPHISASGYFLTTTGGHFLTSGHTRECDGPYGFVQAIRDQIKHEVNHIKLNLTGGIMGPFWDRHWHSFMLKEELEAAFAICDKRGYRVMAHAANSEAVKDAVKFGAHTVEHGYIMDDECIQILLDTGTWYVPTLGISHLTPRQATNEWESSWTKNRNLSPDLVERAEDAMNEHRKWFKKALDVGVKMAVGSDVYPLKDSALLEMGLWVRDGATPWQTIIAATKNAAELSGFGDVLGTIEIGKIADLIVVKENPMEDIQHLRQLLMVIKNGDIVSDKR